VAESIKSYRDLIAWQKSYALGLSVYSIAGRFPDSERFGLISSLRRTGTSVASNIAQGYGRGNTGDYLWFLKLARGELYQIDTQLLFATDLKYIEPDDYVRLKTQLDEAERVLAGLIRSLER
jgi:four helix bundle protein